MSTAYPVTRIVVKDNPPPRRPVISVGQIYPIVQNPEPEIVFRTARAEEEDDEKSVEDAETKVVKPRRGRRPAAATEVAETK